MCILGRAHSWSSTSNGWRMGRGGSRPRLLSPRGSLYGVSVGARVKHAQTGQYATVTKIRDDDLCEVIADNAASQSEDNKHNPAVVRVDPRPDTCSRTASPSYKPGQKLLLLHDGAPVDAIVEEWLGVRRGSRATACG